MNPTTSWPLFRFAAASPQNVAVVWQRFAPSLEAGTDAVRRALAREYPTTPASAWTITGSPVLPARTLTVSTSSRSVRNGSPS